jgi:hypothetical protein
MHRLNFTFSSEVEWLDVLIAMPGEDVYEVMNVSGDSR